jgi:uncharacterized protein YndB with AHSA1/START domain
MTHNPMMDLASARIEGRELVITRRFEAPRELVYQTWTDSVHLSHWWGPEGFTITTQAIDVRPGGVWSYVMHGPDGTDYPNRIQYVEASRPARLVYMHGDDADPEHFRVTVTMDGEGQSTSLTMRMTFPTVEALDITVKQYGALEGAKSTLARLAAELEAIAAVELTISRVFDAPRELVFQAWTNPEQLAHWWGPVGFDIHVAAFELTPGGMFHYRMSNAEGHEMWAKFVFHVISSPDELVYVNQFSNPEGATVRAPFPGLEQYPLRILNSCTFAEASGGKTSLTLRSRPINANREELQFFHGMHASMQQGFGGTFDQLAAHLASRP